MASCGDIEIASRPPLTPMISAILIMTIFDELEPYYARHLSGRELRQFQKAGTAGASRLLTRESKCRRNTRQRPEYGIAMNFAVGHLK